ncbi:MAG: GNAT family N-acetyltransferase [Desulfobacterales bacterium]
MSRKHISRMQITGYYPGAIGHVTQYHAVYYHNIWGFDISFEIQVSSELSEFMSRFNADADGIWIGKIDGRFAGSIAIDGNSGEEGARLRWFITAPELHGAGVGKRLLKAAIRFCETAGHRRVFLWTFEGLDAARLLYEKEGFRLVKEHEVEQWGRIIKEQLFELTR